MDLISCESFGVSSYVSALTSPGRASLSSGIYYYSVPTSPTGGHKYVPADLESEPGDKLKITSTWISSSDSDGFEFTTSCRFENPSPNQQQKKKKKKKKKKKEENCGEDPSAMMAFADELFCNGQVLPLKLPPRLQQVEKGKCNNRSSSGSSPRSPSSLLRWPILCCNLRSEEFDPFVAALENVMKEERRREAVTSTDEKCIKSLSPQSTTPQLNHGSIPREPTEVARLVSESLVGYSRSGHGGCIKPNFTKFSAPEENTCESLAQFTTVNGGSCHRGSANHRIKNSIFRSSFEGWESQKEKLRDQNKVLRKFHFLKRFSFKSFYATLQCKDCI